MRQSSYPGSHGQNRTVPSKHQQPFTQKQPPLPSKHQQPFTQKQSSLFSSKNHLGTVAQQDHMIQNQMRSQYWQGKNHGGNKVFAPHFGWVQENPPGFPKEPPKWRPPLDPYDPDNPWTNCEPIINEKFFIGYLLSRGDTSLPLRNFLFSGYWLPTTIPMTATPPTFATSTLDTTTAEGFALADAIDSSITFKPISGHTSSTTSFRPRMGTGPGVSGLKGTHLPRSIPIATLEYYASRLILTYQQKAWKGIICPPDSKWELKKVIVEHTVKRKMASLP